MVRRQCLCGYVREREHGSTSYSGVCALCLPVNTGDGFVVVTKATGLPCSKLSFAFIFLFNLHFTFPKWRVSLDAHEVSVQRLAHRKLSGQ